MKPIMQLITAELLEKLATRSHYRYGKEIFKDDDITLDTPNVFNVTAIVKYKNNETRTVKIESTPKGLKWKCTCTSRKDLFCKHCVAAGLKLLSQK